MLRSGEPESGVQRVAALPGQGAVPPRVALRSRRWTPALPLWALRLTRLATLVVVKGVIEGEAWALFGVGLPLAALILGYSAWVRRSSTMVLDPAGVTLRWNDMSARGAGVHTIPPEVIDGFEVRRWYPPSFWLDLAGPRWVRPATCLSIRLVDGGYVRIPMMTRPRWRFLLGPRVLLRTAGEGAGGRPWTAARLIRWRTLRHDDGRRLRWDRNDDAELAGLVADLYAARAAHHHTSSSLTSARRAPDAEWLTGAAGLIDLQDRRTWRPEDGCRGSALSAPLPSGWTGDVAPHPHAPVSFRTVWRRWGAWRPLRGTRRTTVGRSGVTVREWGLVGTIPMGSVSRFSVRRWHGSGPHRPWPAPIVLAVELTDGRFVRLPGFDRVHGQAGARVLIRVGVLGRWRWWRTGQRRVASWTAEADAAVEALLQTELERFRALGLPGLVDQALVPAIADPADAQPWERTLGHLIDRRGQDGKPARSSPF